MRLRMKGVLSKDFSSWISLFYYGIYINAVCSTYYKGLKYDWPRIHESYEKCLYWCPLCFGAILLKRYKHALCNWRESFVITLS